MLADPNEPNNEADKWRHRQPMLSPEEQSRLSTIKLRYAIGQYEDDVTDTSIDANRLAFARYLIDTGKISEGQEE